MYKVFYAIIILFSLNFSQETWTQNDYLKKSVQDILENSKNKKILIQTISGRKIPGIFIKYQGNGLHFFEQNQKNETIMSLDDIIYIYAKDKLIGEGTIVFVGEYYKNFKPQTDNESGSIRIENKSNEQIGLSERSTIALEQIAQTLIFFKGLTIFFLFIDAIVAIFILAS